MTFSTAGEVNISLQYLEAMSTQPPLFTCFFLSRKKLDFL